jgi:hypothetical protein
MTRPGPLPATMYLVAIAWMYVVLMMALAEALSPQGTVLGAIVTLLLYGCAPLALVLYLLGTPGRRRARRSTEMAEVANAARERTNKPVSASTTPPPPSAP